MYKYSLPGGLKVAGAKVTGWTVAVYWKGTFTFMMHKSKDGWFLCFIIFLIFLSWTACGFSYLYIFLTPATICKFHNVPLKIFICEICGFLAISAQSTGFKRVKSQPILLLQQFQIAHFKL